MAPRENSPLFSHMKANGSGENSVCGPTISFSVIVPNASQDTNWKNVAFISLNYWYIHGWVKVGPTHGPCPA